MLQTIETDSNITFPELGMTLTLCDWYRIVQHVHDIRNEHIIDKCLDYIVDNILKWEGGPRNEKLADYIDEHRKEICAKWRNLANGLIEQAVEVAAEDGYKIAEVLWDEIQTLVEHDAGVIDSNDDEFGE